MSGDTPSLREYLEARDTALENRFEKFEKDNAEDHKNVVGQIDALREEVAALRKEIGGVVTWRSLGFAATLFIAFYAIAEFL